MNDTRDAHSPNGENFMILTKEYLDGFYMNAISNRPDINVFKLGLIAAYEHFCAQLNIPQERRINTTGDRAACAQARSAKEDSLREGHDALVEALEKIFNVADGIYSDEDKIDTIKTIAEDIIEALKQAGAL